MTTPHRRSPFANPFYLLLTILSTLFVMTALAYWVGPMVVQKAQEDAAIAFENPATPSAIAWLDQNAPALLAYQFGGMLVMAILAMATDHRFATTWRDARAKAASEKP